MLLKTKNPRKALTEDYFSLIMESTCPIRSDFLRSLPPHLEWITGPVRHRCAQALPGGLFNCSDTLLQDLQLVKRSKDIVSYQNMVEISKRLSTIYEKLGVQFTRRTKPNKTCGYLGVGYCHRQGYCHANRILNDQTIFGPSDTTLTQAARIIVDDAIANRCNCLTKLPSAKKR